MLCKGLVLPTTFCSKKKFIEQRTFNQWINGKCVHDLGL